MDIITYALLNKKIKGLTSGIKSTVVDGTTVVFTMNDGSQVTMSFPVPADGKDGVGIIDVEVDSDNCLICTLSDGSTINAGKITTSGGSASLDDYYTKEETDALITETTANKFLTEAEIRQIFAD